MVREIALIVNGESRRVVADEAATLLDVLNNHLHLAGPKFGCGAEQCGSCAVLVDGVERPACGLEVGAIEGRSILTVEGLGTPERPHPLQTAFLEKQAGQCGYCLAGILIGAKALIEANPDPTREEIAKALAWHLCRCGAHNRILTAVALAAERMRAPVT